MERETDEGAAKKPDIGAERETRRKRSQKRRMERERLPSPAGQAVRPGRRLPVGGDISVRGRDCGFRASGAPAVSLKEDFSGVLFIGDSRTVGLSEYGDLGQAEVFADSGMSVFTLFNKTVKLRSQEKSGLEELLCSRKFDTIFFMLGINELGYDYDSIVKQYKRTVEKVHELQPDAAIVLGANLHVTAEKPPAAVSTTMTGSMP